MGRWQRWMVGAGAALALASVLGGRALGDLTAVFPGAVFEFIAATGLIRAEDFNKLGVEVAATQRELGANLSRIPKLRTGGAFLGEPLAGDTVPMFFHAPEPGALTRLLCETRGANSQVTINLIVDDGSPASVAVTTCSETPASFVLPAEAMAAGDRLDLGIDQVSGAPESVSVRIEFQPGA